MPSPYSFVLQKHIQPRNLSHPHFASGVDCGSKLLGVGSRRSSVLAIGLILYKLKQVFVALRHFTHLKPCDESPHNIIAGDRADV